MRSMLRKAPGRLEKLDRKLVRAVSRLPGGGHDDFFRRLSAAANNGKLWMGIAAVMALFPGKARRAALHGLLAQGVASAVTNMVFKTLLPRARPLPEHLPVFRFVNPQPTSSSMPSGHSASAVAFALGVGLVRPALGAAMVTRKWWPVRPPFPETRRGAAPAAELPDGQGLGIAVNTLGGSYADETVDALQKVFPKAYIKKIGPGESVDAGISQVATRPGIAALGVWGGDGTVGAAAAAAVERSLPLLVLPGGTLNHFARDAGTPTLADAVQAASRGEAAVADVGHVSVERGLPDSPEQLELLMLNTASIGLYPNLVRRREQLQPALGKPLAGVVAMFRTFAAGTPTT